MSQDPRPLRLAPDEFTGKVLGKYEVLCRLSMGGMSEIFLALQRGAAGFRKLVVLKQVLPDVADDPEIVRRFLEEAKLMAAFSHPSIAQVYDLDRADEEYFLVMEFVAGVSLLELLRAAHRAGERMPAIFSLSVCNAVAKALGYAHAFRDADGKPRPVIHRDVAPKNVMISFDGVTKLLDFGIAKSPAIRTQVGVRLGTPGYMSPEQETGRNLDATSDLYSLGVVLHECLTGQRFNPEARISDRTLEGLVLKALSPNPAARFTSALEMARAIEEAARSPLWTSEQLAPVVERYFPGRQTTIGEGVRGLRAQVEATGSLPPEAPPTVISKVPPPKRGWIFALAGVVLVAGFGLLAAMWPSRAPPPPAPGAPVSLVRAPPPKPAPAPAVVPPPPPKVEEPELAVPHSHPPAAHVESPHVHKTHEAPLKPEKPEMGTLWVKVRPWARVSVDGSPRGETPLDPFPISAGSHTVVLSNDSLHVRREMPVQVRPHEQTQLKVSPEE